MAGPDKQFSLCSDRAVGFFGQWRGRSLLLRGPGDRHDERRSKCDYRCREERIPDVVLIGLQGVAKVACCGITLHTILLNASTEGYKNLFIVMCYRNRQYSLLRFYGTTGYGFILYDVGHYRT